MISMSGTPSDNYSSALPTRPSELADLQLCSLNSRLTMACDYSMHTALTVCIGGKGS
jgi:hypothetical protein